MSTEANAEHTLDASRRFHADAIHESYTAPVVAVPVPVATIQ